MQIMDKNDRKAVATLPCSQSQENGNGVQK